jgi:hypothetical protein
MPNDAATEKAGSAEHGDGATVRCHHDSNSPIHVGASHCLKSRDLSGRSSTTRHGEVFHRQSFEILGVLRDSRITLAEADVRVMAFCLGKLTNFQNKVERFPEIVESNDPPDAARR